MTFQVPSLSIQEILEKDNPIVDVRTPKEFAEFCIPGAVNVPLFSNEERVEVGTTYKQVSPDDAILLGLKLVSEKLPDLFQRIRSLHEESGREVIVHCWRGGMRSRTVVSLLNSLGIPCAQLEGGIRSFRKHIVQQLEEAESSLPPFIVLEGLTGSRKTDVLRQLETDGYPVLDLEGMAGHRGSLFGGIGLTQNSQKQFECMLWQKLDELKEARYLIIEAESKRIGRVTLPDFILDGKQKGTRIHLTYPFQKRVVSLIEEYEPEKHAQDIEEAVSRIEKRIDPKVRKDLRHAADEHDYFTLISILLEYYYDPKYRFASEQYDSKVFDVKMEDLHEGILMVKEAIDSLSL